MLRIAGNIDDTRNFRQAIGRLPHGQSPGVFACARLPGTETAINDNCDFAIGRRSENLAQLRKIGFAANRYLLDVQRRRGL